MGELINHMQSQVSVFITSNSLPDAPETVEIKKNCFFYIVYITSMKQYMYVYYCPLKKLM